MFVMINNGTVLGVADYLDEAGEFAERLYGKPATWTPTGELISIPHGEPTGWAIKRMPANA